MTPEFQFIFQVCPRCSGATLTNVPELAAFIQRYGCDRCREREFQCERVPDSDRAGIISQRGQGSPDLSVTTFPDFLQKAFT